MSATASGSSMRYSSSKVRSVTPIVMRSPGSSSAWLDAAAVDLHAVGRPEVDRGPAACPRGAARCAGARRSGRRPPRRTRGCGPTITWSPAEHVAPALGDEQRLPAVERRLERPRLAVGRVDHRVPEVARRGGRRRLRRSSPLLLGPAEQLRLDAELAQLEPLVGVELDLRPAREREALLAGVLEQVVGQLLAQRGLVARELLAVLRGQEDAVVVGHVDARDGDHLVLLHLLGELVRQLDRLHARLEGAAERAFDDAAELRLQVA